MNEQKARQKRIQLYKKIIVSVFVIGLIFPIISSGILICKMNSLEDKVMDLTREQLGDEALLSSNEALVSNPRVNLYALESESETYMVGSDEVEVGTTAASTSTEDDDVTKIKKVYLTFDDGPSIYTGQILDILAANDVKATFFVIGRDEGYYPYYKRIVDEGHTLGMHTYTHEYGYVYSSREAFAEDVNKLSDLLYDVTGVRSKIFRFPGGSSNTVTSEPISEFIEYLNDEGIVYYDWNALNGDAVTNELDPDTLVNNVMKDVRKNDTSVVLMHDLQSRHTTVESLQSLIDILKSEGYEILPIDENTPYVQHVASDSVD